MELAGEHLEADVRVVVSPLAGIFVPAEHALTDIDEGAPVGFVRAGADLVPVLSPFRGQLGAVEAAAGERLVAHQRVAWLRVDGHGTAPDPGPLETLVA